MGVEPTGDTECPPTGLKPAKPTGTYLPPHSQHSILDKFTQDHKNIVPIQVCAY